MAMDWTKDQQKVIDLRNRNILVSAANFGVQYRSPSFN